MFSKKSWYPKICKYFHKKYKNIPSYIDTMTKIPKQIIQTSIDKQPQYVIDMLKRHAPDWEYKHFTDKEIVKYFINHPIQEFPNIINRFWKIKRGEHKADLFRYYILYNEGGVFIDSDAMLTKNLDDIAKEYEYFSVNSYLEGTVFQGFLGAMPRNQIIYKALKDVYEMNNEYLTEHYYVLTSNMYLFVHNHLYDFDYKLYRELQSDHEKAFTINDENEIILVHYWKDKVIPNI